MKIVNPFANGLNKDKKNDGKDEKKAAKPDYIGEIKDTYYYRLTFNKYIELDLNSRNNKRRLEFPSGKVVAKEGEFILKLSNAKLSGIELIRELASSDQITIDPLNIEVNTKYKISNITSEKQTINPYDSDSVTPNIILLPYSARWKTSETLRSYNFLEMQRNGQIQVERQNQEHEIQDRALIKAFIARWKKIITRDSDITSSIKDNYYYQLYNRTTKDLELVFPSPDGKEKKPEKLVKKVENKSNIQVFKGVTLHLIGKQKIQDMYDNYLINLVPLDIEVKTNYVISNRTAQPLTMKSYRNDNDTEKNDKQKNEITIPPFGNRVINSERLRWYDFLEFRDSDQIRVERINQAYKIWDWIKLAPFIDWLKKLTAREADVIGSIKDTHYYRVYNKTEKSIELPFPPSRDGSENKPYILPLFSNPLKTQIFSGVILNAVGKKRILDLVNSNLVSFQPLDLEVDTVYKISNRTQQRIGISNYNGKDQLIIPPLGTRLINSDKLKWYSFLEWYWQDLIRVEPERQAYLGTVTLARIWDWVKLLPGVLLVALAGFGIPLWIVYHFGDGARLFNSFAQGMLGTDPSDPQNFLGRVFQVGFICIASILPALFYYLFGRQQVEKLREKFFRDVLVLDPHLYNLSEAEAKYDTLLNSAFGSGGSTSPFAILLLIFSTALLVTGWTITISPYGAMPTGDNGLVNFFQINPTPLTLGFLGVYFFSINMIFRRYVRADLTPKTYASIIVRLLVSLVLVFTISVLPNMGSIMGNALLAVAFIIGIFPEDGFRLIRDSARRAMGERAGGGDEKYPITQLEGMNQYDQARLLEEGIENIENLAHHNLIELLAFTRIPTARLVDMFDQAILYLHVGIFQHEPGDRTEEKDKLAKNTVKTEEQNKESSGTKLLNSLKSLGIRTATDLMEILNDKNTKNTVDLIGGSGLSLSRLQTIEATFRDDEWLAFILNWRKESAREGAFSKAALVTDPNRFYEAGIVAPKTIVGAVELPKLDVEVIYDGVNVRTGPGLEYTIVEQLKKGALFIGTRFHAPSAWIEFEHDKWYAMTYNNATYMKVIRKEALNGDLVTLYNSAILLPGLTLEITNPLLRVRSGPGTECPEVAQLKHGDKIIARQMVASRAWVEIGKDRWVALTFEGTQYLKFA